MSVKSDLYRFIRAALLGGEFTDACDTVFNYECIEGVKSFEFWNSELLNPHTKDSFPAGSIFMEFSGSPLVRYDLKTKDTENPATTKDLVRFVLHHIGGKYRAERRYEDYLDLIDLADLTYRRLNGKNFANCKSIHRVDEFQDTNSAVLMDWSAVYECNLSNIGETDLTETGNVTAEIQQINLDPNPYIVKN